jgi:hypothetical protein
MVSFDGAAASFAEDKIGPHVASESGARAALKLPAEGSKLALGAFICAYPSSGRLLPA